ncbi:hypothetical protein FY534_01960 [Alicyclobacillus sp. TC]|uniref:hypothetical protein n=1 Tax=Alicyclobacillus sp. TC TaxID=2606450 RepID=UPI001933EAF6|nr:hypothetical protein [Alicyclobacillus sp. TC]QRF22583.1 hypothetical protein FY534_01960 [Alicyclobacillus sp. TC]
MNRVDRSRQSQSPLSDAQEAVESAVRASKQALSHPSTTMLSQAEHAIQHAEKGLLGALSNSQEKPWLEAAESLEEAKSTVSELKNGKNKE